MCPSISVECCRKEEEEESLETEGGGRGTDQPGYQREGGRRPHESASIQHIKIPMANRKPVKFRCLAIMGLLDFVT